MKPSTAAYTTKKASETNSDYKNSVTNTNNINDQVTIPSACKQLPPSKQRIVLDKKGRFLKFEGSQN